MVKAAGISAVAPKDVQQTSVGRPKQPDHPPPGYPRPPARGRPSVRVRVRNVQVIVDDRDETKGGALAFLKSRRKAREEKWAKEEQRQEETATHGI